MTLSDVIDTLQTWIRNADDEYDREEMGRVAGLKEALHEIKKIEPCEDAISRQAALDLCKRFDGCVPYSVLSSSDMLPPVTPLSKEQGVSDVIDKIRAEIEQAADKQFQIAMGVADLNERYAHIQMETAYRHSLNIIDKVESEE